MMRRKLLTLAGALTSLVGLFTPVQAKDSSARPNFLVIVADDLGFSDLGAFGGEITTPNLDALAYEGIRFTGFHTTTWCAPTRAMLLSGTDHNLAMSPQPQLHLRPDALTIAELLRDAGYRTMHSGKWHLGDAPEHAPHRRGFQRSLTVVGHGYNHFGPQHRGTGWAYQVSGPSHTYVEDGKPVAALPENLYSSDYFATRLIDFLRETKAQGAARQPFFAYLAFIAPHAPLHAPREDIAKYRGRYDAGFDVLKEKRLARQKELGLLDASVTPHSPLHTTGHPPGPTSGRWKEWSAEQRQIASRDMEVYAAMVERLDHNVGRVLDALRQMDELQNTVILFLSDNGAQGAVLARKPIPGLTNEITGAGADNRLENRGLATSHVLYAPGWAEAASAPSWLYKNYATEGGTRNVAFLRLPGAKLNRQIANVYVSVADALPTFLDLAGVALPKGQYKGRAVQPITGRSWAAWLKGESQYVYGPNDPVGTGMGGSYSLRQGDWKITDAIGDGRWLLFNIAKDPGETTDLSGKYPQRKAELRAAWEAYAKEVGVARTEPVFSEP